LEVTFFPCFSKGIDARCYTDLSRIALKKGKYNEAITYAKNSIEGDITNFFLVENTRLIRDAFKHLNQDSFYVYNEKLIAILEDNNSAKDINELQEFLKKEELAKKELELIKEKRSNKWINIGMIVISLVYGLILFYYANKPKEKKGTNNLDLMPKIKETEIDRLRHKVNTIERSLLSKEIDLERQRSFLYITTQHLKEIAAENNPIELKKSIKKLSHQLKLNQNNKDQWAFFSQQFEQIHPDFFNKLRQHTPNLSTRAMRLCAYGRLGMTNQEIAQILGIATNSVSKARHRLKKKMNLEKEQDLNQFLASL